MDQPPSNPKEPRGPVSLRIKFRSASLDQFIERYAVDVSRGGIFIRTREPLAVGTQLRFDFQLQDAAPLLAGEGTIVWIRENDPARAGVTPGMGVRFDKLTPASQPVLEKILAEKVRREQSGAPAKTGPAGGMAVRRPSSTFSALDPAAARAAAAAASGPPRVGGLSPLGAGTQPRPTVPAAGAAPLGAQPKTAVPATGSATSDVFGAQPRAAAPATGSGPLSSRARTAETAVPGGIPTLESSGAFGRPRTTTGMNAQRPAPAPSSLFEKPTADDIDRALSVLTEVEGPAPTPVAAPVDFSSRTRRPTDAQPVVLESAPDVGDAPSRRTGTRPLFSGTSEIKVPTIPVATLGEDAEVQEEDDATSAWVGSGPTRVGGSPEEPELEEVLAQTAPPKPSLPAAPSLSLDAPPPAPAAP
ncbi:MAG TPA: TIGR02266 family protein, partial [Polyangia bacterium]|nr:TIGR02266 family protein [Polyangia bacterium]